MYTPSSQLGVAALGLARGGGSQFLERMLFLATDHMGADGAVLIASRDDKCDVLCSVGLPLSANAEIDLRQFNTFIKSSGKIFEGARENTALANWMFVSSAPFWQSIRAIKLDIRIQNVTVVAIFGSHQSVAPRTMREPPPFFGKLIEVLHDLFSLITEIADLSSRPMFFGQVDNLASQIKKPFEIQNQHQDNNHNVVERFLMDTLIQQPRVISRGTVSYHAVRRWRRTVKTEQISALKAIKRMPSSHFEVRIAEEMSSWCRRAFGGTAFANVVAVPCGHSGDDCLSKRIGQQIATMLGIKYVNAFESLKVCGSSHPKTNVIRPKMKLLTIPIGPILLVDDVATSGSHIEEATMVLRKHELAVTSMVWISAN